MLVCTSASVAMATDNYTTEDRLAVTAETVRTTPRNAHTAAATPSQEDARSGLPPASFSRVWGAGVRQEEAPGCTGGETGGRLEEAASEGCRDSGDDVRMGEDGERTDGEGRGRTDGERTDGQDRGRTDGQDRGRTDGEAPHPPLPGLAHIGPGGQGTGAGLAHIGPGGQGTGAGLAHMGPEGQGTGAGLAHTGQGQCTGLTHTGQGQGTGAGLPHTGQGGQGTGLTHTGQGQGTGHRDDLRRLCPCGRHGDQADANFNDSDEGFREGEEEEEEEEEEGGERTTLTAPTLTRNLRHRGNRRPVHERLRQKRQTLQDMARPLKHWLYKHRTNPYPTKDEKVQLAASSRMTLTQVSNWFANARRRLKNTVQAPGLSWGRRIKLYNSCVEGNAERLSICSDDELWDSDMESTNTDTTPGPTAESRLQHVKLQPDDAPTTNVPDGPFAGPQAALRTEHARNGCDACANSDDGSADETGAQHRKYKHSILHRYLNDSYDQVIHPGDGSDRRRNPSGSLSSHDYEEWSSSSCSSPSHNVFEDQMEDIEQIARQWQNNAPSDSDDMYFKEISAALALTTLARGRFRRLTYVKA